MPSIEELLSQDVVSVKNIDEVGAAARLAMLQVVEAAAAADEGGLAASGVSAIGALVGAIAGFIDLPLVVTAISLLMTLRWLQTILVSVLHRIPMGLGNGPASLIDTIFSPLDWVENWIGGVAHSVVMYLMHDLVMLVGYLARASGLHDSTATHTIVAGHSTALADQVAKNTDAIGYLDNLVTRIEYALSNVQQPQGVPANVWDQLHHVEAENAILRKDITTVYDELGKIKVDMANLTDTMNRLTSEIHGVRAIQVGVSDLVGEVVALENVVKPFIVNTEAEQQNHTRQLAQLAPLGLLLEPGIKGLRNLRKLEDQPCQCPQLPGIPNEWGTVLSLIEFAENG